MKKLKVHENNRYLMWDSGEPFFYLGDTAWELFHKLTSAEIKEYVDIRAGQGFNAMQAVLLAERDGLLVPNPYGRTPLKMKEAIPETLELDLEGEYSYWDHVDFSIRYMESKGMFAALLPSWGDKWNRKWGKGPEIFSKENAFQYGKWLGDRYKDQWNIIWVMGGDRPIEKTEHKEIIDAMADGIRKGDGGNHLMTFHPPGAASSIEFVKDCKYIDFHSIQSGHSMECYDSSDMLKATAESEKKPYMDMECRYEDHIAFFNRNYYWSAADVRSNCYWNILEGACGQAYGHFATWCFHEEPNEEIGYTWKEVTRQPAAEQMKYLLKLRMSRSFFSLKPGRGYLINNTAGITRQACGIGDDYLFAYTPQGLPIQLDLSDFLKTNFRICWFNPRTGEEIISGFVRSDTQVFVPPTVGCGQDWILVLDFYAYS